MGPVSKVIVRVLVVEFYKHNVAFFGLILLVFFGFIRGAEHVAIGKFLVSFPSALFFLYGLWLSYLVKILLFTGPAVFRVENQFLSNFSLLTLHDKRYSLLVTSCLLFLPAIAYGAFLLYLAVAQGFWIAVISVILAVVVFTLIIGMLLYKKLSELPHERTILQFRFATKYTRPAILYFTEHVLRNEPVLFFLTKAYSCLLIVGTSLLYQTDEFDLRLFTTGILLALSGNVALLNKYVIFYYHKLTIARNLPYSFGNILLFHLAATAVILIPEFIFLVKYFPLPMNLLDVAGLVVFGSGICMLIFSINLMKEADMEKMMIWMFWMIVGATFLILFSIHPMALGVLSLVEYSIVLKVRHYRFEFTE